MKWEYCTESIQMRSDKGIQELLALRGSEGWELVTIYNGSIYFKRPVEPVPPAIVVINYSSPNSIDEIVREIQARIKPGI